MGVMRKETSHTLIVAATDEAAHDTHVWYRDTVGPALRERGRLVQHSRSFFLKAETRCDTVKSATFLSLAVCH